MMCTFKSVSRLFLAGALATLMTGAIGSAQAVPFKFIGTSLHQQITVVANGGTESVSAGLYKINLNGPAFPATSNILSFCTDIAHIVAAGYTTTANLSDIAGASGIKTASYIHLGGSNGHTTQQSADAVAYLIAQGLKPGATLTQVRNIQVAIWDIVNDGGDGVGSGQGQFYVNDAGFLAADATNVSALEAAAYGAGPKSGVTWVQTLDVAGTKLTQDFGYVPEPAFYQMTGLLGLGAFSLLKARRRAR